ncbi:hypothetical protein JTB14_032976 [Gonioctena quinquepunctata]|nr:hypothetical protein JTB14_032976 [Gonioctena quinquepunctata]
MTEISQCISCKICSEISTELFPISDPSPTIPSTGNWCNGRPTESITNGFKHKIGTTADPTESITSGFKHRNWVQWQTQPKNPSPTVSSTAIGTTADPTERFLNCISYKFVQKYLLELFSISRSITNGFKHKGWCNGGDPTESITNGFKHRNWYNEDPAEVESITNDSKHRELVQQRTNRDPSPWFPSTAIGTTADPTEIQHQRLQAQKLVQRRTQPRSITNSFKHRNWYNGEPNRKSITNGFKAQKLVANPTEERVGRAPVALKKSIRTQHFKIQSHNAGGLNTYSPVTSQAERESSMKEDESLKFSATQVHKAVIAIQSTSEAIHGPFIMQVIEVAVRTVTTERN